jgi:hypothetical protein
LLPVQCGEHPLERAAVAVVGNFAGDVAADDRAGQGADQGLCVGELEAALVPVGAGYVFGEQVFVD